MEIRHRHAIDSTHIGHLSMNQPQMLYEPIATEHGSTEIVEDGAERCVNIVTSGWIDVELPWVCSNWKDGKSKRLKDGSHFFGVALTLRGSVGDEPHVAIGSAWAMHLPH